MTSINAQAPVVSRNTILIHADAKKVWKILTDINQWPAWQTDIPKARLEGELITGASFDWKTGGAAIHSTLHTVAPFHQFGWTGKTFGLFAVHNWSLSESNGLTTVHVEESMEGFLARLLKGMFQKNLEKGMQRWLDMLKVACE